MQLGRFQVSTLRPNPILSVTFSVDGLFFSVASETGYEIWKSWPLGLVCRKSLPGTLALVLLLPNSPLLVLQGGGSSPLYPPNKAVIYHDGMNAAVAELEFGERIRGLKARQSVIVVALSRKAIAFEYGLSEKGKEKVQTGKGAFWLRKVGEWETAENENGLIAISTSPGSTLLALPGRQPGHVQLINLPPCPSPSNASSTTSSTPSNTQFRSPILLAHEHPLSTLACTSTGSYLLTASERGTLLRVWDTNRGRQERELRRGVDRAQIWGTGFEDFVFDTSDEKRRRGGRVVGWSDKGTVHVWGHTEDEQRQINSTTRSWVLLSTYNLPQTDHSRPSSPTTPHAPSLAHMMIRTLPLPKYFSSTASIAQYHLPRKNPHAFASVVTPGENDEWAERFVVGWVEVDVEPVQDASASPGKRGSVGSEKEILSSAPTSMGSREERRSFGSDATSTSTRTATPTFKDKERDRTATPTRRLSYEKKPERRVRTPSLIFAKQTPVPIKKKERQLIAITYSGDWYRLKIPQGENPEAKMELVEYRRLGVGGGGW
ncbi:hypothetical protein P7C73_g5125, partial [Tremellales sp. Uapishka_1]